jgi:hypothetical protein
MSPAQDQVAELLTACRQLVRTIITVPRGEEGQGPPPARVRTARGFVEAAVLALATDDGASASLDSIASSLTTRLVQDLLLEDERQSSQEAERKLSTPHDRDGLHGYSWSISLPDLMGFLHVQQKSGVLRVNIGSEVVALVFEEGDLIHASSDNSPPGARLGEILVELGAIDVPRLERFLLSYSRGSGRLGTALEESGLITEQQLRAALDRQILRIFQRLFGAENAYYTFREGHSEDGAGERRNVFQLLLEACRAHDESRSGSAQVAPPR